MGWLQWRALPRSRPFLPCISRLKAETLLSGISNAAQDYGFSAGDRFKGNVHGN
ncbi:hypothetical protein [uncultured Parasphingorhabdus sp.]|uniref:hypothetical protein n=1 Tax=uncultured Parasphingorhabdus sp. TaxID=2709694 RepID=UPI0030D8BB38